MGDRPLVSILMPVFNGARFLPEAVESVRAQTYADWELLICDDGSTDGSKELACRYAAEEPRRIRALAHPDHGNLGTSAARNLGLRHASGELVAILDADDVWLPQKLEEQTALMGTSPAGALFGATRYWHGWTGDAADLQRDWTPASGFPSPSLLEPPLLLRAILERRAAVPCMCSIIARREVVQQVGGFEEEFRHLYEDQAFYAKIFVHTRVLVVSSCWDLYRQHSWSICATVTIRTPDARLRYLNWLGRYLRTRQIDDVALWSALHGAIREERQRRMMRPIARMAHIVSQLRGTLRRLTGPDDTSSRR